MKNIFILISFILLSTLVFSQKLKWAKSIGSKYSDEGKTIEVDRFGNVYVAGDFSDSVDFDPGPGVYIQKKGGMFILKLDSSGNFLWVKSLQHAHCVLGRSLKIDSSGNVYITGRSNANGDYDPGPGVYTLNNLGSGDVFILKLNSSGDFVWAKSIGSTGNEYGETVTLCSQNNIIIAGIFGEFKGKIDFDPGPGTSYQNGRINHASFLLKLDSAGNFIWLKVFDYAYFSIVKIDMYQNIYVTGGFTQTVDFDPGPGIYNLSSNSNNDLLILKLDSIGNFIWASDYGEKETDVGTDLEIDGNGNVYVTGSADIEYRDHYILLIKFNKDGKLIWDKKLRGNIANGQSIVLSEINEIYITGHFRGSIDFDPGPNDFHLYCSWGPDIYIAQYDTSGNFIWAQNFGAKEGSRGMSLYMDKSGTLYSTGSYSDTVDFDLTRDTFYLSSKGYGDIYILKMNICKAPFIRDSIYGSSIVCEKIPEKYSIKSISNAKTYFWSVPNGTTIISGQNSKEINVKFGNSPGYVTLYTTNDCGIDSIRKKIIINTETSANFSTKDVCEPDSVSFTNLSKNATNYKWKFGDGEYSTKQTPKHFYNINGVSQTYNVTLVSSINEGCRDSTINVVSINAGPISNFDWNVADGKVNLKAKQTGNSYYRWLFNNIDSVIWKSDPSYNFSNGMKVCLKAINAASCISETCKEIWVGQVSQSKISGFKIYPNPNTGNFTIEIDNPEKDVLIEVYNSVGERVKRVEMVGKVATINLDVASGIYLVKVRNGEMEYNQKVSIVK